MPWKGVTVSEQRQRFLEDYQLNYYSVTDLAERFGISRNTAYRWINRFKQHGQAGYHELSRRPHTCPWQTDKTISDELVKARKTHPSWGPKKLLDMMQHRDPGWRNSKLNKQPNSVPSKKGYPARRLLHRNHKAGIIRIICMNWLWFGGLGGWEIQPSAGE